ncbi:MAG: hypothetical protein AAFN92_04230 [Bacteroidota bacterium]
MERIFHKQQLGELAGAAPTNDAPVQLKRQHLWLSAEIAADAFAGERQVYVVYYPQRGALLLAPMSDDAFKSLHECSLVMLKDRNVRGDKSLSLQEIVIDNDLDGSDRPLAFTTQPGLRMLQVKLTADA